MRKSPAFTLSALLVLALGIGANTAIFSVVNGVLLKPLPFPDSGGIMMVIHVPPAQAFPGVPVFPASAGNYLDWRKQNTVFEAMAALNGDSLRLGGGGRPQAVSAAKTDPEFFRVLRVRPEFGRAFTAEESQTGRDAVVVLSHGFAQSHFGSAAKAVGRKLELDGRKHQVVGVMPAAFQLPSWWAGSSDLWAPLA